MHFVYIYLVLRNIQLIERVKIAELVSFRLNFDWRVLEILTLCLFQVIEEKEAIISKVL